MSRGKKLLVVQCDSHDGCPVATACGICGFVPCLDLASAHEEKLRLCAALEALADGLPSAVDRLNCLRIANQLLPLLRESHRYEEESIFPAFEGSGPDNGARAASVRRLKAEHVEDECAAQDLTDVLLEIGHGGRIENPEALGFMLRAFFETMRRHVAFEREHILPVVFAPKAG